VAGHRKFLQRISQCAQYGRKKITAQVLPDLQGNGLVRQRSISTDLTFCFFCVKTKEIGHSGYERYHAINIQLCIFALTVGDCFVPRNDAWRIIFKQKSPVPKEQGFPLL